MQNRRNINLKKLHIPSFEGSFLECTRMPGLLSYDCNLFILNFWSTSTATKTKREPSLPCSCKQFLLEQWEKGLFRISQLQDEETKSENSLKANCPFCPYSYSDSIALSGQ